MAMLGSCALARPTPPTAASSRWLVEAQAACSSNELRPRRLAIAFTWLLLSSSVLGTVGT